MFNILFVFFKNLLPISFPRPLITVNLSQCKKFHFNSTTVVIVAEMIFLKKYLAYFLMGVQNLWNHFTICNRHKNFFHFFLPKVNSKFFRETFQLFSTIIRQISHLHDFTLKIVKANIHMENWRYQQKFEIAFSHVLVKTNFFGKMYRKVVPLLPPTNYILKNLELSEGSNKTF